MRREEVVVEDEDGEKVLYMSKECSRSVARSIKSGALRRLHDTMLAEDGPAASSLARQSRVEIKRRSATRVGQRGIRRPRSSTCRPPLNDRSKTFDKQAVCRLYGGAQRPAILMFEDNDWVDSACRTGATASGRRRCAGSRRRRAPHQIH